MSIKIVTDSASDILPKEAEEMGITLVPLTLLWEGQEYRDAFDFDHETFFKKLESSEEIPTTSQVTPAAFSGVFKSLIKEGDEILVITISSGLSGTYQSALIAKQTLPGSWGDKVHVVDSLSVTVGERVLVQQAIRYCDEGLSAGEIAARLEKDRLRVRVIAKLDTLKYLKKGGRISSAAALAGEVLSIKPVITLSDGAIVLVGKARGSKSANNLLRKMVVEAGGIDFSHPCCLVYSGQSDEQLQQYIDDSKDLWSEWVTKLPVATIGSVIGTHAGPGAIGVAYFERSRNV